MKRYIITVNQLKEAPDMAPVYWIQEQAPNGEYFDKIGMPGQSETAALAQLRSWRQTFPHQIVRLILRKDIVVKG